MRHFGRQTDTGSVVCGLCRQACLSPNCVRTGAGWDRDPRRCGVWGRGRGGETKLVGLRFIFCVLTTVFPLFFSPV